MLQTLCSTLWLLPLSLCAAATSLVNLSSYGICQTPNKEPGLCLHIDDCQHLYSLLLSQTLGDADRVFLAGSQCGYDNTQTTVARRVLVCCAENQLKPATLRPRENTAGNILPEAGVCGSSFDQRIYGGTATKIDEFPWMALIEYKKPFNRSDFHCGASLINNRYVLTAAHCVRNPDMPATWTVSGVRLGEWDLETNTDCDVDIRGQRDCAPPHVDVPVERVIVHENYVSGSRDQFHDIALLRLAYPVSYSFFIKPICLPVAATLRNNSFQGFAMDVAGWGLTEKSELSTRKLKIMVDVWDTTKCQEAYSSFQININSSQQLCAGGKEGIDTCRGDSGGPLMLNERLGDQVIYFVAGVVSYGPKPCGLRGWPGVYTRIGNFIDWIQNNLEP